MFSKLDGPTSLRAELVRALAFSLADVEQEGPDGMHLSRAAVAGIWNGDKGVVVVILRQLEPAAVTRYRFAEPIHNEADLDHAVEAGIGFALSLGFLMDDPDFRRLGEVERHLRIARWDEMRKVRSGKRAKAAQAEQPAEAVPEIPELELAEPTIVVPPPASASPPPPSAAAAPTAEPVSAAPTSAGDAGKAVLARIALSARGLDPLGRLLSFF
jgi:hypothetical protein